MTLNCKTVESRMAKLLLEPGRCSAEVQSHLDGCAACRAALDDLRATMALLDEWTAPEPNPYFLTRLGARLDEERRANSLGWIERLRARFLYSATPGVRPLAAMAMTVILLVGGGAYISLTDPEQVAATANAPSLVVSDLENLDHNAQLLDDLEMINGDWDDDYEQQ